MSRLAYAVKDARELTEQLRYRPDLQQWRWGTSRWFTGDAKWGK